MSYAVRCAELELALHDIKDAIEAGRRDPETVSGIYHRVMRELFGDVGLEYAAANAANAEGPVAHPHGVAGPDEPLNDPWPRMAPLQRVA